MGGVVVAIVRGKIVAMMITYSDNIFDDGVRSAFCEDVEE